MIQKGRWMEEFSTSLSPVLPLEKLPKLALIHKIVVPRAGKVFAREKAKKEKSSLVVTSTCLGNQRRHYPGGDCTGALCRHMRTHLPSTSQSSPT